MTREGQILNLTVAEYCYLASVLGAGSLLGIDDPWPDMNQAQVQEHLATARESLVRAGVIRVRSDNRVVIEPWVAGVVSACAFPEVACILSHALPGFGQVQRYLFLTKDFCVEMATDQGRGESEGITLLIHENAASVLKRIVATFRLTDQMKANFLAGSIPQAAMPHLAQAAAEHGEATARAELEQLGLSPGAGQAIAATLAHPRQNGSLVVMAPAVDEWTVDGLGLLEGDNALWRLGSEVRYGQPWVLLEPASAEELRKSIEAMISRHLPGGLD